MVVSGRLMFVLLVAVTIVISRGQAPPNTGLYFTLSGTVYLPGDTILITDIGSFNTDNGSDPGSSLVCVTTNVNTRCCRGADNPKSDGTNGQSRGEWYLPDGTRILNQKTTDFYRTRYNQTVRLNRRNNAMSPTGIFTCVVPNDVDSTMNHTATIRIVNVTLTESGGTPTEGQDYMLTCTVSGGGSMAYTYMWLKDGSVVSGQTSSTYSFSPLSVTDSGRYSCRVRVGSTAMTTSRNVTITVVAVTTEEPSEAMTTEEPSAAVTTEETQLNVMLTGSGGTLTEGQNHVLTCTASGGESMAYNYMWLKDGNEVSGQTSSTYSFSPLLVVHSGQYSCRVSTVTSEVVDITVERTTTQLYFTWRGNRYESGDSILITDIRLHRGDAGPGDSLVCVTTDVNTQCCTDTGGVGEWFLPNGNMVTRNIDDPNRNSQIIRTGRTNQVRLNFRNRQTSPTGEYTCVVPESGGSVNETAGIRLVRELPRLNVMLTVSDGTLEEGQNHMLTCTASGGGSMAYTYMWLKDGREVSGQTSFTYSFSPLSVTDSGRYNCRVSLGSTNMISGAVTITVIRVMPNPPSNLKSTMQTATSITITWTDTTTTNIDRYEVAYSYTVRRCSAPAGPVMTDTVTNTSARSHTLMNLNEDSTYTITVRNINGQLSNMATITANTSTAVPSAGPSSVTPTTVGTTSITIEWSELDCADRNGDITGYRVCYGTTPSQRQIANISDPGRRMFTVDRFITLSYAFEVAAVNVDGIGPYSTPPLTVDTAVPSGLGFYLNGMAYSNNSVVTITDIGEGNMSLYCISERSECCRSSDGGERGDWFLPGQDSAVEDTSSADFSRRREPRAVVLERRNNAVVPIGLYRCEVPDAGNTIQSLYVGVYTNDRGRPSVSLASYSHVSQTLNCTSSGGPATNVIWRKDNVTIPLTSSVHQQSQRVADEVTSTYHNLLSITSSNIEDHSGSFSCTVENNRGNSENYLLDINKIEISGNQNRYQLGSSYRITCSSDLTVQSIQWLNTSDNREILTSNTGEQQLVLEIDDITAAINNTMYTCEVTLTLQTTPVVETILIIVGEEGFPRRPESVIVTSTTPTGVTIQWMLTEPFNAAIPETFVVLYGKTQNGLTRTSTSMVIATSTSQTYSIQLNSLDIGTQYYFQVQSRNRFGSVVSDVINFITNDTLSGPVRDLQTNSPDNSTLVISWRPPITPNGNIISYTVRIENLTDGTTLSDIMDHSAAMTSLTESGLVPGVPYCVSVAAVNRAGQGSITTLTIFTKELAPSISPKDISIIRNSPTMMVVSWTPLTLSEARGFITNYTVFYSPQVSRGKRQEPNTMEKNVSGDVNRTIIDGLDPNTAYDVQMSAITKAGTSSMSNVTSAPVPITGDGGGGGGGGGAVIGVVVGLLIAVLLVVVIVIAIIIFIRYRRGTEAKYSTAQKNSVRHHNKNTAQAMPLKESNEMKELEANEQNYENTEFIARERLKPIPVDKFAQHVQRMHADRDRQFELEYNSIEKSPQADYEAAVIPKNKARNRFGNIFPYDFNRVILKRKPGEENSDYINASYIDGYRRKKVYIGSQGPTENSLEDFWRMIWEQRVPTIVMLTRIFEGRKKCEEYWPENVDTPFVPVPDSPLSIQYDSVLPFPEFIIRKMTVTNSDEPGTPPLTVTLYHYLGWPDHGVPVNAISMVNFVKRVRKNHPYSKEDLLLVHCSAGVGRTGTFITLDSMLERINVEKSINILEFVSNLRKQRVLMVQTVVQYVFIHNALDELLTCGETEISAANMRIVIGKLSRPSEGQKITGFSKQFETLRNVSNEGRTVDFSNASSDVNMPKNRYKDILPNNHMRVRLKPSAAHGSDYINASFIEGYRQKGAYIATQGPLPNTVNDFWRMIWEHEVKCIVMLNQTEEKRQEVCHRYWPLGRGSSEAFGKCLVTLTSQENNNDYIIRKMDICENQSRISVSQTGFTITQIQYLKWPEDSVPQTTAAVLEIANLIQKVQMGSGNKSIVVMCNNGIGRSGAFICVHSQMERMKAEAMVDIFQFIKAVRIQRAGLVTSKEQYEFCHHVLADFLDGFDTYANFKEIV